MDNSNGRNNKFNDILTCFDLKQHVNFYFPTHIHGHWLDILITKRISNSIKSVFRQQVGLSQTILRSNPFLSVFQDFAPGLKLRDVYMQYSCHGLFVAGVVTKRKGFSPNQHRTLHLDPQRGQLVLWSIPIAWINFMAVRNCVNVLKYTLIGYRPCIYLSNGGWRKTIIDLRWCKPK